MILFFLHICLYEFMFQIKMGKFRKERRADSNSHAMKIAMSYFKINLPLF